MPERSPPAGVPSIPLQQGRSVVNYVWFDDDSELHFCCVECLAEYDADEDMWPGAVIGAEGKYGQLVPLTLEEQNQLAELSSWTPPQEYRE